MANRVAFVFPGQGSQRIGMLEPLTLPAHLIAAFEDAEDRTGTPLREIAANGPNRKLSHTAVAQPLLYLTDLAWADALEQAGVMPELVAGHSLGELAALTFAGALSLEDGVRLVCERGRIMADVAAAVPGTMAAVLGMERDVVASLVADIDGAWIANDNSSSQAVISGTGAGIEAAIAALSAAGARKIVPLEVAGPFHCPLMAPARDAFAMVLDSVEFAEARIPVVQNTEPSLTNDPALIRQRLAEQITAPVRWRETMDAFVAEGITHVIEAGPGAVLAGLGRKIEGLTAIAVETDGVDRVTEVLNG